MRIAIPVNEKSLRSMVCVSFGRAPYFLIYDTNSRSETYLENSAASSQGGAGIRAAQIIVDQKASALLTPRCGQNAADVFKLADITLYKTPSSSVQDVINDFNEGKLPILNDIHSGFHGGR